MDTMEQPSKPGIRSILRGVLCVVLAGCVLELGLLAPVARAGLVATDQAIVDTPRSDARARVTAALAREDVRRELRALGVDPGEAEARVAALDDAEVEALAARIDALPAGGDSVAGVLLVIALVFFGLIALDYFGVTDIFPWVHKRG